VTRVIPSAHPLVAQFKFATAGGARQAPDHISGTVNGSANTAGRTHLIRFGLVVKCGPLDKPANNRALDQ
jgi:hypothetical protein